MFSSPDPDTLLEALIFALQDEILPALSSPKAQATAVMMQSMLQQLRQTLPVSLGFFVDEHNTMSGVLLGAAAALRGVPGPAADRVRARAVAEAVPDIAPPPSLDAVMAAHRRLTAALEATLLDLDEIQRGGGPAAAAADAALGSLRAHFGPRYLRDVSITSVGSGFIGRG